MSSAVSLSFIACLVALEEQREALAARHRVAVVGCDAFHLGAMSGFLVSRIAQHHAVCIKGVHVALLTLVSGHYPRLERRLCEPDQAVSVRPGFPLHDTHIPANRKRRGSVPPLIHSRRPSAAPQTLRLRGLEAALL